MYDNIQFVLKIMLLVMSCLLNHFWGHFTLLMMKISHTSMFVMILVGVLQWNWRLIPSKLSRLGCSLIPHLISFLIHRIGCLSVNQALMVRAYDSRFVWLHVGLSNEQAWITMKALHLL